jgi:hypothetical protein
MAGSLWHNRAGSDNSGLTAIAVARTGVTAPVLSSQVSTKVRNHAESARKFLLGLAI